ncbi:acylneuraminate cytidylyltransferase family protein [Rothia dentocariosa]
MRVLCVIPVRGGSKGIPRKNLREIAGKPLVAWTILQALAARDELAGEHEVRVVVSTEDQELAAIARHYGAEVPFMRPAHLAEDTTATEPVIEHAIDFYTGEGWAPDAVMLLQATSPVRLPGTLARAVRQFAETGKDSLVGVIPIGPFIWRWHPDAEPTAEFEIMARPRRQELTQETFRYRENGSLYLTKTHVYTEHHNRLAGYPGGTIDLFTLHEVEGVDIDAPIDFAVAEHQLKQILEGQPGVRS